MNQPTPMLDVRAVGDPDEPTAVTASMLVINPEYAQEVEDAFPDREMFLAISDHQELPALKWIKDEEDRAQYISEEIQTLLKRLGVNLVMGHMPTAPEAEDVVEGEVE